MILSEAKEHRDGVTARIATTITPPRSRLAALAAIDPPARKSGLPDLRIVVPMSGEPDIGWGG